MGLNLNQTQGLQFGPAGVNHAPGLVPDPGSVAHSPALYLGDDGGFHTAISGLAGGASSLFLGGNGSLAPSFQQITSYVVQGSQTNDLAPTGFIGEYIFASTASGSALSLSNGQATNTGTVVLGAGDWDLHFHVNFVGSGLTQTFHAAGISQTSGTRDDTHPGATYYNSNEEGFAGGNQTNSLTAGPFRVSLGSTASVYSIAQMNFSAGSVSVWGLLAARRAR